MQLNLTTNSIEDTLEYELMETPPASKLAGRPVYVAKMVNRQPVNLLSLAEKLAAKTPYRVEDVIHILSSLADLMRDELAQGHSINFGSLFQMTPTIHGTFDSVDEAFDPDKHRVVVKACTGKLLRDAASEIKPVNTIRKPVASPSVDELNTVPPPNDKQEAVVAKAVNGDMRTLDGQRAHAATKTFSISLLRLKEECRRARRESVADDEP